MATDTPIFEFGDHYPATIAIADKMLPIKVKRLTRTELEQFKKRWDALFDPRGDDSPRTAAEQEALDRDQRKFTEDTISEMITLEPGLIKDRGQDVTTGAQMIDIFHSRSEVLVAMMREVYAQNHLSPLARKNLNSPRGSDTGSETSIPTRGGEKQGPTAVGAASSDSAPIAAATASSESEPSGASVGMGARTH